MKKVHYLLLFLFLLAAIGVGLFLATFDADRYRPMVSRRLEAAIGRPVRLQKISLQWRGGIAAEMHGLAILEDRTSGSPPLLEVGSVSALLQLMPLLRGNLQIGSVLIQAPSIRVVRRADGTIEIPGLTPAPPAGAPAAASSSPAPASRAGRAISLLIQELEVLEGRLTFSDPGLPSPLTLEEIRLKAGLDLRAEQVDLKEASAKLDGGTFSAKGMIRHFTTRPEGELYLRGEKIRLSNVNLLRELFDRLTILPGLTDTLLSRLPPSYAQKLTEKDTLLLPFDLHFTLENGVVSFPQFQVATDSFELTGSGRYGLDGSLDVPARITVQPDLSQALVRSVEELRLLADGRQRIMLPVRVTGTVRKPSVSPDLQYVASKLFSNQGQELVGELLNKVLEKKKKKKEEKQ